MRRIILLAALLAVGGAAGFMILRGSGLPKFRADQWRGMWIAPVGDAPLGSPKALAALDEIHGLGASIVAIGPEAQMPDITKPDITFGADDDAIRAFVKQAKARGLEVFLLPRIESPAFFKPPYPWRADIKMAAEADWPRFHENFAKMAAHYGALAKEEGVAVFGLGLEYRYTAREHPEAWRKIAKAAKDAFGGPVTYSANWDDYDQITWWDAVDLIGIGAYFQLADSGRPDDAVDPAHPLPAVPLAGIRDGWKPVIEKLSKLSSRFARPIWFTEVGYTPFVDTAYWPWRWQETSRPIAPHEQAQCYRALFHELVPQPWFRGLCAWRWYTDTSSVKEWDYSPQHREAADVIREAYGGTANR